MHGFDVVLRNEIYFGASTLQITGNQRVDCQFRIESLQFSFRIRLKDIEGDVLSLLGMARGFFGTIPECTVSFENMFDTVPESINKFSSDAFKVMLPRRNCP